jgi:hypothetical protein
VVVAERANAAVVAAAAVAAVAAMKVARAFSESCISVSDSNAHRRKGQKKGWKNEKALTPTDYPQRL